MQVQPNSTTNIQEAPQEQQNEEDTQFSIIQFNGNSYRVATNQYISAMIIVHFCWAFWSSVSFIFIALIIENFTQTKGIIATGAGVGASLILTGVIIYFRKNLPLLALFSIINLDAYLAVCLVLVILEIESKLYPTIPFTVIEFILLAYFLEKKIKILISIPLIAQLYLIVLQVDKIIEIQFTTVFFIVIILVACFISISIIGFLYLAIKIMLEERVSKIKKYGLIMTFLNFTSLSVSLGVLPEYFIFSIPVWIGSIIALSVNTLVIIFILYNLEKEKLFFCDVEIIQGNSLSVKKKEFPKQYFKQYRFIKMSESWCKKVNPKKENPIQMFEKSHQSLLQCLICLQNLPSAIWMPCGHFTTCERCCEHMITKNNIACILCKKIPKQIYFIDRKGSDQLNEKEKQRNNQTFDKIQIMEEEANRKETSVVERKEREVNKQKLGLSYLFQIKKAYKIQIQ